MAPEKVFLEPVRIILEFALRGGKIVYIFTDRVDSIFFYRQNFGTCFYIFI